MAKERELRGSAPKTPARLRRARKPLRLLHFVPQRRGLKMLFSKISVFSRQRNAKTSWQQLQYSHQKVFAAAKRHAKPLCACVFLTRAHEISLHKGFKPRLGGARAQRAGGATEAACSGVKGRSPCSFSWFVLCRVAKNEHQKTSRERTKQCEEKRRENFFITGLKSEANKVGKGPHKPVEVAALKKNSYRANPYISPKIS